MKLSGLLHRTRSELPGVSGVARVDRHTGALLRRLRPGDVAVLDQVDLDRATADALVAAAVVAVVNAAPSISGRFPNLGPQILVDAGIPLVDAVGAEVLHAVKDGVRVRVHEGVLYAGEQVLAEGVAQTADSVADALVEAKSGLAHQLEAFAANTIEFMRRERGMLLDGVGVPDVQVDLADRQVLVVAAGYDHVADLARLRRFVREHRPRLIGVGAGADALLAAGHRPDLIVGNPAEVSEEALTCGADVVVPAFTDGHAPGLHRVQDLGAGAVTFLSGRRQNYTDVRLSCLGEGKRRASVSLCLRRLVVTRRSPYVIELSAVDRAALQQRARAYTAPHHQVMRAKIVLLAADGLENTVIADRLDVGGAAGVQVAQAVLRGGLGRPEGSPADRSAAGLFPLWRW